MSFKFNPLSGNFDYVNCATQEKNNPFAAYARYNLGKIANLEEDNYNLIDCCNLPITTTRAQIDLGTLNDLCN